MESTDSEPQLEELRERVETALGSVLESEWEEVLGLWSDASPSGQTAVRSDVLGLRNRVLNRLMEVDSVDDFRRTLAIQYVELKCRWLSLTLRIRECGLASDAPGEQLLARAACVSLVVRALERLLHHDSLSHLAGTLVEPLSSEHIGRSG